MNESVNEVRRKLLARARETQRVQNRVDTGDWIDSRKTPSMLATELKWGQPLEVLLQYPQTALSIAVRLRISESTVSKWRLILGLRQPGPASSNHIDSKIRVIKRPQYLRGRCSKCNHHWASRIHRTQCRKGHGHA